MRESWGSAVFDIRHLREIFYSIISQNFYSERYPLSSQHVKRKSIIIPSFSKDIDSTLFLLTPKKPHKTEPMVMGSWHLMLNSRPKGKPNKASILLALLRSFSLWSTMVVNLPCLRGSCPNFLRPTCPYTECHLSYTSGSSPIITSMPATARFFVRPSLSCNGAIQAVLK